MHNERRNMTTPDTQPKTVYKVLAASDWRAALEAGSYAGSPDDSRDGFIHLSTAAQLAGTLAKHFKGKRDLVLVALETANLGPELKWEPSRGGALFPHLYAPLDVRLAKSVRPMPLGADDVPVLPLGLEA